MKTKRRAEKTMLDKATEFRALTIHEAAHKLHEADNVLILFHINPDGDAVGSAFALREALTCLGKRAFCVCSCEVPERLRFISRGTQKSVLAENIPSDFDAGFIVSVDTASPSQLGALYEMFGDRIDLMIDHHGKGTPYADGYIIPEASSCGEVLFGVIETLLSIAQKPITKKIAECIYAALSSDTGCFRYSNTSSSAHLLAARLLEFGIDSADINHRLFGIKNLKQMQVEHAGFERMNLHCDGRIAVITFPYDLKKQYGATDEDMETLIDVARCVKGVEVAATIKQATEEKSFRVSMRSSSDFDVSEICAHYGGGGHARAAGCTLLADSILAAEMTVVVAVEQKLQDDEINE